MAKVIVLLGPPGSGKSTIGRELAERGVRWREWEVETVERWGSRERFAVDKKRALDELHTAIEAWIDEDDSPCAIETTGLSDGPWLEELRRSRDVFLVRLDVSEDVGLARVGGRQQGDHLSDDPGPNRRVWSAYTEQVIGAVSSDLVIDTETTPVDAAADMIESQLR